MPELMISPPYSPVEPVTDMLHGIPVTDPYRWLEDQNSLQTQAWIDEQTRYARAYMDSIPGRERICQRIREFLAVETYDSVLTAGNLYFFRKRLPNQEQPCIYMREGADGEDELLLDPAGRRTGNYTALKPWRISRDGRLLLYEVKEGGERTGTFELLDIQSRKTLQDTLRRGYLRGFVFAPDGKSFYYVHQPLDTRHEHAQVAYHHVLGTSFDKDHEIFRPDDEQKLRLYLVPGEQQLGLVVYRYHDKTVTDFYVKPFGSELAPEAIVLGATYAFVPLLLRDRILAATDLEAPNLRIVEVHPRAKSEPELADVVPTCRLRIQRWAVADQHLYVSYARPDRTQILVYNLDGKRLGELPVEEGETVCLVNTSADSEEVLFEAESFVEPSRIFRYVPSTGARIVWANKEIPFAAPDFTHKQVWYTSLDGTQVPMFLFGRKDVIERGCHPTVMTAYGGFGISMTPQFSVLVAFLVQCGCLFALPNIRGGSEFGEEWHAAAKRRNRQTAFDDFLAAAEWLVRMGRTEPQQLAIFGGSNSGLLVGVAITQRPGLFRAALCMVPMLDMLRYHLFDSAYVWTQEYGTAEDLRDFSALARYSPYHNVRDRIAYPAVMLVSGDADANCNPLHARKMTARLQAANVSPYPILLDYSKFRGHSPVLPLSERIRALTDRIAFLCDQLGVRV